MAHIGCLGSIPFYVSSNSVKTISNVQRAGAARYGEHKRHLSTTLTEFTGVDAGSVSFDMVLSAYLGVDPGSEINQIVNYMNRGKTLPLVIGDEIIGKYRWTIKSYSVKMQTFGKGGSLTSATVSISLLEYLRS